MGYLFYIVTLLGLGVVIKVLSNPITKLYLKKYIGNQGFQIGNVIYTLEGRIYSTKKKFLAYIKYIIEDDFVHIHGYIPHFEYKLNHVPVGTRQKLTYIVNGKYSPLKYIPITPFKVNEGILRLETQKRRGFSFIYCNPTEGKCWPFI